MWIHLISPLPYDVLKDVMIGQVNNIELCIREFFLDQHD